MVSDYGQKSNNKVTFAFIMSVKSDFEVHVTTYSHVFIQHQSCLTNQKPITFSLLSFFSAFKLLYCKVEKGGEEP